MRRKLTQIVGLLLFTCLTAILNPLGGTSIPWQVLSGGGEEGTSMAHKLSSTVGQTAAGSGSSGIHHLNHGFQQNFTSGCNCGDADGSGGVDISDVVSLLAFIFGGGPAPNPYCLGDADSSGGVDISDAVFLIAFIFGGGPSPHCS